MGYFKTAEISGYITQSITSVPIRSEPGPDRASYSIKHSLDQRLLSQKMSTKSKQGFKAAVKALRLEAPHTHTHVEDKSNTEEETHDCPPHTGRVDENEEGSVSLLPSSNEQQIDAKERSESVNMLSRCVHLVSNWKGHGIKYKTHCIDCDSNLCEGRFNAPEPVLMFLGCGELDLYSAH